MVLDILDLAGSPKCAGCARRCAALCPACRLRLRPAVPRVAPPPVGRVVAALDYRDPARALVLELKLRANRTAAQPLVGALAGAVASAGVGGEIVTWVPGRTTDIRARGFDHAEVLARGLAARLGLPAGALLERSALRPDQAGLNASERRTNLEGAFRARSCPGGVVLVDDLVTTGATARSCAEALIAAGAEFVELIAACSAAGPGGA